MTQNKIPGKFYPLQNEEWVKVCKDLTKSQMSILYYLRSLDPYSNGIKVKVSKIAQELDISRKAVYAAITVLEEKKYICLEDIEYSIKVSSGGCLCDTSSIGTNVSPPGDKIHQEVTAVTPGLQDSPGGNKIHQEVTAVTPGLQVESETQVLQDSQNSKINKTYLDFKDSLLEEERENFLEFGKKKAAQLPIPPQLPLKWIETNFEELREQWEKSQGRTNSRQAHKWENHPQREEWLEKIRQLGPVGFQAEDIANQKLRREFYMWAEENKLIWGQMES